MRTLPLAEVIQMSPGELVPQTKGTVKVIFDPVSGVNDKGKWTLQNFILKDGEHEIKVKLSNRTIDRSWKGKLIWLIAHQGEKGLSGLKIVADTYKGKTTHVIQVSERAEMVEAGVAGEQNQTAPAHEPEHEEPPRQEAPPQRQAPAQTAPPASGITWKQVDARMAKMDFLYAYAIITTVKRIVPEVKARCGLELNAEQVKDIATTKMIQYARDWGTEEIPSTPSTPGGN